jgi:hypothetical protein
LEQFGKVNVLALAPPSGTALIPMIFDEFQGSEFLQVMVEIVAVNIQRFLQLNGAHFLAVSKRNIGAPARWMGEGGRDWVASYSSHSRTCSGDRPIGFEDVPPFRKEQIRFEQGNNGL